MEPAFDLALQLEDRKSLGPLLWGLWVHYQTRTEFAESLAWLDTLEKTAAEMADPELLAVRDMSGGCQYFWQADYEKAASYTDHIKATYDAALHGRIVEYANHDPLCFSLHWAGSLLDWITGYPDRAVQRLDEALELARNLGHPFNSAFALTGGSQCLIMRGESERMLAHCEEAERIIAEEGLGGFAENSMVNHWRGQALIVRREFEIGYDLAKRGNDFFNASGGRICNAMWWSLMAIALEAMGRPGQAEVLIERAIAHCRETGDRYMEPEALRIRGEFALADDGADPARAEALLNESIAVARRHGARSWELRAATSLAKLSLARGKRTEAYDLLQPVYDGFTEGFGTVDLVSARSLLDELR